MRITQGIQKYITSNINPDAMQIDPAPPEPLQIPPLRFSSLQLTSPCSSQFVEMTDIFEHIDIAIPAGKVILCETVCAEAEGIGDMKHLIRFSEVLHTCFPEHVQYRASTDGAGIFDQMVKNHKIDILKPGQTAPYPDNLVLHIGVSLAHLPQSNVRTYHLGEIQDSSETPILNMRERLNNDHFGLLPEGQGIWVDTIPKIEDKADTIFNASQTLKTYLGVHDCQSIDDAKTWIEKTWIIQSYYYSEHNFFLTLLAQLKYLNKESPHITHCFVKYNGKNREGDGWSEDIDPVMLEAFNQTNVRSITINQRHQLINPNNKLELRLKRERISNNDYPVFLTLLNAAFPGGDNTYSEAFSNPNLSLPPFPENRDYKTNWLDKAFTKFPQLGFIHHRCKEMNTKHFREYKEVLEQANILAYAWESLDNPQSAWFTLLNHIKTQDVARRIPAIVKEQLFFALFPEAAQQKVNIILAEGDRQDSRVDLYRSYVQQAISSAKPK